MPDKRKEGDATIKQTRGAFSSFKQYTRLVSFQTPGTIFIHLREHAEPSVPPPPCPGQQCFRSWELREGEIGMGIFW